MLRAVVALGLAAMAGCATTPATPPASLAPATTVDEAFELTGRLSARSGSEAAAANFRWAHRPQRDELSLSTPMGQTLARLAGDAANVRLEFADGRIVEAGDWEQLTVEVLGAPIPVSGLAWWVRAVPHPGSAHTLERDTASRPLVLRQDGWEIVYGYADSATRPSRLRLSYPEVEIRLAIDAWSAIPAP